MKRISIIQFIFLLFLTQVGIGVLSLPRELMEEAGTDGWISILFGWIVSMMVSIIIIKMLERNPDHTIFDLLIRYFGKWLGKLLVIGWVLYGLLASSVVLYTTLHVIKVWILQNTAQYVLMMLFCIPIYMITNQGLNGIARFAEAVAIFYIWMPFLLLYTLSDLEWVHLLPIIKNGWLPIFQSMKLTVLSFLGFELAFLLYPYLEKKEKAIVGILIANTMSMLAFLSVTVICFLRFSSVEVLEYIWPTLNLLKLIRFSFLERIEIIFLPSYLFILFMTIIPYLFLSLEGINRFFPQIRKTTILGFFILAWIVSSFFFVPTYSQVTKMGDFWGNTGLCLAFVFPVFLWLYQLVVRFLRKGRST